MKKRSEISGLLISAGLSSRMGAFKPLLVFENLPYVVSVAKKMLSVCGSITIVTGHNSEAVANTLSKYIERGVLPGDRIRIIENKDYERGMFSSLQAGIAHSGNSEWILYHFVDQPSVPVEFYSKFAGEIDDEFDWIQPSFNKIKGHPVLFNKKIAEKIKTAGINSNLKLISDEIGIAKLIWECGFENILHDMDTKEDLNLLNC